MSRQYSDWIKAYLSLFDGRTEAPEHLHYWTAISTIGGSLCRQVWIEEELFRFFPNFYNVFVGAPGLVTKSTTISLGINMLREVEGIYLAADATTYPAFVRDLAKRSTEIRDKAADDLVDVEYINQCAVTAAISEFGTFFKPEDEDMVNGLTDLFDCRPIMVKDTKTSGTDVVEHPFVNIVAATTPDWIHQKVSSSIGGWGLSSRILFIFADKKARYIARPSKMWPKGEYSRITKLLIEDLKEIAKLNGPMSFSPAADAVVEDWYNGHSQRIEEIAKTPDHDKWLGYFLARKQTHIHKLSIVLSASRRETLVIEEEDILEAIERVNAVEETIAKVFTPLLEPTPLAQAERKGLRLLHEALQRTNGHAAIPKIGAASLYFESLDSGAAIRIIDGAIARGEVIQVQSGRDLYLRIGPGSPTVDLELEDD